MVIYWFQSNISKTFHVFDFKQTHYRNIETVWEYGLIFDNQKLIPRLLYYLNLKGLMQTIILNYLFA